MKIGVQKEEKAKVNRPRQSVLISIQPKWCERIANGEKVVEVRKTKPKLDTPFKCYIYCTKGGDALTMPCLNAPRYTIHRAHSSRGGRQLTAEEREKLVNGKVIGEFICDSITYLGKVATDPWDNLSKWIHEHNKQLITEKACLTEKELLNYGGEYAWHISDLVIYDKPIEWGEYCLSKSLPLKQPPQSWCYIELKETAPDTK